MQPGVIPLTSLPPSSYLNTAFINDSFKSLDLSDLLFLDLHAPIQDLSHHDIIEGGQGNSRNGLALDLAQSHIAAPVGPTQFQPFGVGQGPVRTASPPLAVDQLGRPQHHRVQSQLVVAPKDLLLSYDSRQKRASWDGGAA